MLRAPEATREMCSGVVRGVKNVRWSGVFERQGRSWGFRAHLRWGWRAGKRWCRVVGLVGSLDGETGPARLLFRDGDSRGPA